MADAAKSLGVISMHAGVCNNPALTTAAATGLDFKAVGWKIRPDHLLGLRSRRSWPSEIFRRPNATAQPLLGNPHKTTGTEAARFGWLAPPLDQLWNGGLGWPI